MLSLNHHELMGKTEEHEEKNYLIVNDHILDKVLDGIKQVTGIENFDNTKILIDTYEKLSEDITFKNVVIFMTCVIKDDNKFYP